MNKFKQTAIAMGTYEFRGVRSPDILVRGGVLPGVHIQDALPDGVAPSPPPGFAPRPGIPSPSARRSTSLRVP